MRLEIQNRDNIEFTLTALSGYHLKERCFVQYTIQYNYYLKLLLLINYEHIIKMIEKEATLTLQSKSIL